MHCLYTVRQRCYGVEATQHRGGGGNLMEETPSFVALLKKYLDARKLRARGLAALVNSFFIGQEQPELADIKPASVQNWLGSPTLPPMLPSLDEPVLQIAVALGLNRAQTTE